MKGGFVLAVGIDWAEEFHLVALGRPGDGVFDVRRVEHSPKAVDALVEQIAALEPDPAEVRGWCSSRGTGCSSSGSWTPATSSCRSTRTWSPAAAARRRTTPRTPASPACSP